MEEQLNIFLTSSQEFLNKLATMLPRVIGAILVLLIGWVIAKFLKKLFVKLLTVAKFNYLTEKTGIDKFLKDGGSKSNSIDLLGTLFYWTIMLIVIMTMLNSLKLTAASTIFNEILLYVPNVIVAIVILVIGIYLAGMVSQIVKTSLKSMQDKTSDLISKITFVSIIVLTVFLTLGQLNIAEAIVTSAFQIIFGAMCLALALAFGLGGRDKAAQVLDDVFKKNT